MITFATGKRPWYDRAHDINLAKYIYGGEIPEIPVDTPRFYAKLIRQCWDNDPEKRPTAAFLNDKLGEWIFNLRRFKAFRNFKRVFCC